MEILVEDIIISLVSAIDMRIGYNTAGILESYWLVLRAQNYKNRLLF